MQRKNFLGYIKEFGVGIFCCKSIRRLFYSSDSKLSWRIDSYNEKKISRYLSNVFQDNDFPVEQYIKKKKEIEKNPIWVMWYQGEEQAPEIVKLCINSIRKHSGASHVYLITEENLMEYIDLPDFIMEKVKSGCMTKTHLSDVVRLTLLAIYGGAWIDATIFVKQDIPSELFDYDFYSLHFGAAAKNPGHGRWTTFLIFAKENNELIKKVLKYHYCYWNSHNILLDYVMFDYIINYVIEYDGICRNQIESIPINNTSVFKLCDQLNEEYTGWDNLGLDNDTIFFKLSWKEKFKKTIAGKSTVYSKLLHMYYM